jgi:hypothetical protein
MGIRRCLAAGAVTAVAVALAGCGGQGSVDPTGAREQPTISPMTPPITGSITGPITGPTTGPTTGPANAAGAPSAVLALAGLAKGAPPSLPWLDGDTLVVDAPVARVPGAASAWVVVPYGSGTLKDNLDYPPKLIRYDADGTKVGTVHQGSGLAWSRTFGQVAWWDGSAHELVVASSTTGRVVRRFSAPGRFDVFGVGDWLAPDDVLVATGRLGHGSMWRTGDQTLTTAPGRPFAVSPDTGMVAGSDLRPHSDIACLAVFRADEPRSVAWKRCLLRGRTAYSAEIGSFSPNGELLLIHALNQTFGSRPFVAILDARTGKVVARFDEGRYGGDRFGAQYNVLKAAFEDDRHVLLVVADETGRPARPAREAIVRCDVSTATCRLATTPRAVTHTGAGSYGLLG